MLSLRREARGKKAAVPSGARSDTTESREENDRKRQREGVRQEGSPASPAGPQNHPRNLKVTLWILASLLALVDGALPGVRQGADPSPTTGGVPAQVGQWPSETLEVEDRREGSEIHSSWSSLLDNPPLSDEAGDHYGRWERSPSNSTPGKSPRKNRKKSKGDRDCWMERKKMRVRDLGLGFDSDEIVLFKYCAGTCHSSRMNYDLALKTLMDNGTISKRSSKRVSVNPCCRPTRYETVTFMDAKNKWRAIKFLSAASCSCVG